MKFFDTNPSVKPDRMYFSQMWKDATFEAEYKGVIVNGLYRISRKGTTKLKFTFVSTASKFPQAIVIHYDGLVGELLINGNLVKPPKKKFPQLVFSADHSPKEFEVEVHLTSGNIAICNGFDSFSEGQSFDSLCLDCAMIIENLGENKMRFHCNDHEMDDDFDDLVFDMEIIEL